MNGKYIVVDVETPNSKCNSICQIGCVLIDGDSIICEWSSLVNPETPFDDFCIGIHGITPDMVSSAPIFPEIWEKVKSLAEGRIFVAHNARFDIGVLCSCIDYYGIEPYVFTYTCTYQLARRLCHNITPGNGAFKLNNLARSLDVPLNRHHDALFDAECCAGILLRLMSMPQFDLNLYLRRSKKVVGYF